MGIATEVVVGIAILVLAAMRSPSSSGSSSHVMGGAIHQRV
jgi:hypothetical protein